MGPKNKSNIRVSRSLTYMLLKLLFSFLFHIVVFLKNIDISLLVFHTSVETELKTRSEKGCSKKWDFFVPKVKRLLHVCLI